MDLSLLHSDVRQIRSDVGELVALASRHTAILEHQNGELDVLKAEVKTAIIPITFFKYVVAVCGGLATVGGVFYGLVKGIALLSWAVAG